MGSSEADKGSGQEVASSNLSSVISTAERLLVFFRKQERLGRIARSLLVGSAVAALCLTVVFAILVTKYFSAFLNSHLIFNGILFVGIAVGSWLGAAAITYVLLCRSKNPKIDELSTLISRIRSNSNESATTENSLILADKILSLLPKTVRKRVEDPILIGILAGIVVLLLSRIALLAALVGIVVWLYFRHRMNRAYNKAIKGIEDQRRLFEERKEKYLESL